MSTVDRTYHHGDLRTALLAAAIESLESGETPSMRAVARRAGVSPAAPYRHFADRGALDSALAVRGFEDLHATLTATLGQTPASASPQDTLGALAVAYVGFALSRPALFHVMFGNDCDQADNERVRASGNLHDLLGGVVTRLFPTVDGSSLSLALWSLAHGMAFLHLDGKLRPEPAHEVESRIRAAITAILALNQGEPS